MPFDVVMSSTQQADFERTLVEDFDSIATAVSRVDVRTCGCTSESDTAWLLGELDRDVGLSECNQQVIGLLQQALVAQGRDALRRLPGSRGWRTPWLGSRGAVARSAGASWCGLTVRVG